MLTFHEIHQRTVINCETLPACEIEAVLQSFAAVRKVDLITTAILLARSQNTLGKKDWVAWAEKTSGLTRSECYHRAKVGHLMIACSDKKVLYRNLLKLSGDKLLALSRLPLEILEGFLSVTPVADMPIDQVRDAVNCQLCYLECQKKGTLPDCEHCIAKPKAAVQAELPGFSAALDAIWEMDAAGFISGVTNDTQAVKCASGGCNLLSAYLHHEKSKLRSNPNCQADTISLLQIKAALLDSIKDIENILAGVIEEENNEDLETESAVTAQANSELCSDHTENACANQHTIPDQTDPHTCSTQCGDHTENSCANQQQSCGDHTANGTNCPDNHGSCGCRNTANTAGECSCRSTGTAEIPAIHSAAENAGTPDAGSDDRCQSRCCQSGGVSDSPAIRSAGRQSTHL